MHRQFALLLFVATALISGCQQSSTTAAADDSAPSQNANPGRPQPRLPVLKLWLGAHEISAELAATPKQHEMGMMFRTKMEDMEGMLFIFPRAEQRAFWMKNTTVPLDVAYVAPDGVIREIHPLHPLNENPVPSQSADIQYVLEMNQGWFSNRNVSVGMEIRTEKGSLRDTFFRR
jgi:uncharacterized membrane protein (UPF0127 family)